MILVQNYLDFMDVHDLSSESKNLLHYDFCVNLMNTLKVLGCNDWLHRDISEVLFVSMMNQKVHYHTPAHILAIFKFAERHEITLNAEDELAIFFHDAIYRPGSEKNEMMSIDFMKSLLTDTGISNDILDRVSVVINATKYHLLDNDFIENIRLIMDLDMSGFAADQKSFDIQNFFIQREFYNPSKTGYSDLTLDKLLNGRMKFLQKLKAKKTIYRTERFKEFEPFAQANLQRAIDATQNRISCLDNKSS